MTPQERTDAVLDFSADGMTFTSKDIAKSLHLTPLQARRAIHPLVESGKILAQGNTRARTYRIKRKRARFGIGPNLAEVVPVTMTSGTISVSEWHPFYLQEAYDDLETPQNRPSKWQRIVDFLKGN